MNELMKPKVFEEQPLALPGSAKQIREQTLPL